MTFAILALSWRTLSSEIKHTTAKITVIMKVKDIRTVFLEGIVVRSKEKRFHSCIGRASMSI